jgi:hypothetical protein
MFPGQNEISKSEIFNGLDEAKAGLLKINQHN